MKIIKNKKLFGVLNALDIIIICVVAGIVLPFLKAYIDLNEAGRAEQKTLERFMGRYERASVGVMTGPQAVHLDVGVSFKNISADDRALLKVGDTERLSDGTEIATILALGQPEPNYFIVNISLGQAMALKRSAAAEGFAIPGVVRLYGILQDNGEFVYKSKPLHLLKQYMFKTPQGVFDFAIEEFPQK